MLKIDVRQVVSVLKPDPEIKVAQIGENQYCYVIDDALETPESWARMSVDNLNGFTKSRHNAYPGIEMLMPQDISASLDAWFTAGEFFAIVLHSSDEKQVALID